MGNVTLVKERTRGAWNWTILEQLAQDGRYALRGFKDNPGFALTAILSLALGLGTSLAIYTVADNLLLRPLPYSHSSQLVMLWEEHLRTHFLHGSAAPRNYFVWKARNDVFQEMAVFDTSHAVLADNGQAEEVADIEASANLLAMLGVEPILGRRFTEEEGRSASDSVLIVSYRVWQSLFGGDRNILGKHVQFGGRPRTIVGVLPANFYFQDRSIDIWSPLKLTPAQNGGEGRYLRCLARLKSGVTFKQAQSEMSAIARQRAMDDPYFNKDWTVTLEPLRDALVREVKPSLLVLLGAVGLLLAVACANVANLLLARYTARQREMALRASLGAGRLRVVRQLLTESILLALLGGALGMLLARWAVMGLVFLAPKDLTQSLDIVADTRIYAFAACLTALTSILFGLAPALVGSRSELVQRLQTDGRSSIGGKSRLRSWFVGVEIALSVILLSGALLLFRSLEGLQNVRPGINAANLLTLRVSLPGARYTKPSQTLQFFTRAVQEIESLPGVRAVSAISHLPFNGRPPGTDVTIAGRPPAKPGEGIGATVRTVMPGYFRTMGIPLLKGRDFTAADNTIDAPYRFIVSKTFVNKYLSAVNPLDQQISVWMDEKNPFGQIVGVVDDVRDETLDEPPTPTVYYPHAHLTYNRMVILVRSDRDPLGAADSLRRVIRNIDPAQPIADVRTHGGSDRRDLFTPALQYASAGWLFGRILAAGSHRDLRNSRLFGFRTNSRDRCTGGNWSNAGPSHGFDPWRRCTSCDWGDRHGHRRGSRSQRLAAGHAIPDRAARSVDVCGSTGDSRPCGITLRLPAGAPGRAAGSDVCLARGLIPPRNNRTASDNTLGPAPRGADAPLASGFSSPSPGARNRFASMPCCLVYRS